MSRFETQLQTGETWASGGLRYTDGTVGPMDSNDVDTLYLQRLSCTMRLSGEQPDSTALPDVGALRGDISPSSSDKEIK